MRETLVNFRNRTRESSINALAWTTAAFALHWSWQTCVLYLPTEVSSSGSFPWYLQNLLGLLAYATLTIIAPRVQTHIRTSPVRWTAASLLAASCFVTSLGQTDRSSFTVASIIAGCLTAVGGTLVTTCRFDLLCHIRRARDRTAVVLLATIGQLLVFLVFRNLPHTIATIGTYVTPLLLAFAIGKGYRSVATQDAAPIEIATGPHRQALPSIQLLAFFLLALSLNFMRGLVETVSGIETNGYTVGLTVFITIIFVALELMLGDRNAERLAPFSVVAFMSISATVLLIGNDNIALAMAFSSAGFYVFVALFWQVTSGYHHGQLNRTVYISSATHTVYTAGLFSGQLVFRALGHFEQPDFFAPLLTIANIALAAAFVLYIRDLEKRNKPDHQIYLAPGLRGTLEADGELLTRKAHLTRKEQEAIIELALGKSIAGIAQAQGVSENTVKTHVAHAYRKLDIHSREDLMELICQTDAERLNKAQELER